jgi:hypothetical protein
LIASPAAGKWNVLSIPPIVISSGARYWIAVLGPAGTGALEFRDRAAGSTSVTSSQSNLSSLPLTWSSGTVWPSSPGSVYLTN